MHGMIVGRAKIGLSGLRRGGINPEQVVASTVPDCRTHHIPTHRFHLMTREEIYACYPPGALVFDVDVSDEWDEQKKEQQEGQDHTGQQEQSHVRRNPSR